MACDKVKCTQCGTSVKRCRTIDGLCPNCYIKKVQSQTPPNTYVANQTPFNG